VVGVNAFTSDDGDAPPLLHIDGAVETDQIARLRKVRSERDGEAVGNRLEELRLAAEGTENLMPRIIDAVRALCTEGEITSTLAGVFGGYREPAVF
jgi:methylmalonyl-CoA mutase N-terminal domain/subunit